MHFWVDLHSERQRDKGTSAEKIKGGKIVFSKSRVWRYGVRGYVATTSIKIGWSKDIKNLADYGHILWSINFELFGPNDEIFDFGLT